MVMPKETIATGAASTCPNCQVELVVKVCQSPAGYYLGTYCTCGPFSRESGYYRTESEASDALKRFNSGDVDMLR